MPDNFLAGASGTLPDDAKNAFDREALPPAVRCLADASFDAFRAALVAALPDSAWVEPDDATEKDEAPADRMWVRCIRRKCVKGVPRMSAKVTDAQDAAAAGKAKGTAWPFTATLGDVLRASVTAPDAAGVRAAWEGIRASDRWTVVRLKNKFRQATRELDQNRDGVISQEEIEAGGKFTFPNLHVNLLFQADGCAPVVAEVQVRLRSVLPLTLSSHKLYEVVRAESIAALAGAGRSISIQQQQVVTVDETEALKAKDAELAAKDAENAALREQLRLLRDGAAVLAQARARATQN